MKVGLVRRLTKMLLELMLSEPVWARAGVVGVVEVQVEGWPEQVQPDWVWQLTQPAEAEEPVSQVSPEFMTPFPQVEAGTQAPLVRVYPEMQEVQTEIEVQVGQIVGQGWQPEFALRNWPAGQVTGVGV